MAMSTFSGVSNVHVSGGAFTNTIQTLKESGMERLVLSYAPGALHNSSDRYLNAPRCHPNTRIAVIDRVMDWVTETDTLILWVYGAAGAGKSAIAQSLADMCVERGLLLASFFFSRTDSSRNTITTVVPTLAYQVTIAIPGTRPFIEKAIERNPMIFQLALETQIAELILQPLLLFEKNTETHDFPRLIIIDGLDECVGQDVQTHIPPAFANAFRKEGALTLRILFTSRPEQPLKMAFERQIPPSMVDYLALDQTFNPDQDIHIFLESKLADLKANHPMRSHIDTLWPATHYLEELVRKSSGQFIYAATVVKYISSIRYLPSDRLDVILGIKPSEDSPFSELDALYTHILSSVEDAEIMKQIMGVLFLVNSTDLNQSLPNAFARTTKGLASLLFLSPATVLSCLNDLSSVLSISEASHSKVGEEITVHHVSLGDYLFSKDRSGKFYTDPTSFFKHFVSQCLRHIEAHTDDRTVQFAYLSIPPILHRLGLLPEIRQALKSLSLADCYTNCQSKADQTTHTTKMKHLFPWWSVTRFLNLLGRLEAHGPYTHQLARFDELVISILSKYPSQKDLITVIILTSLPPTSLNLTRQRMGKFFELFIGNETLRFDGSNGLHLLAIYDERAFRDHNFYPIRDFRYQDIVVHSYFQLLHDLFKDTKRSMQYSLCPISHTCVALECLQFVTCKLSDTPDEARRDAIRIAVSLLPLLLLKSTRSSELIKFLRSNEFKSFPPRLEGLFEAEETRQAITKYLRRFDPCISFEVGDPFPLKSTHDSEGQYGPDWGSLIPPETIRIGRSNDPFFGGPNITSPDTIPPGAPPPGEIPLAKPAWRTVHQKKTKKRDTGPSTSAPAPPAPVPPQHMVPRFGHPAYEDVRQQLSGAWFNWGDVRRQQLTGSWATWQPDRDVVTPPSIEPTLMVPGRQSPGLFGPRTPSSSGSLYDSRR